MGFSAKAEYTLELIREPQRHNHVDSQFFCTGLVLATSIDETVLEELLENWERIDNLTSNRIRFLFFLDNETSLMAYPQRPHFSEDAYRRYHQRLLQKAQSLGFEISVKPGELVQHDGYGALSRAWQPDEKVRRLANQLGVTVPMPCLVWAFDQRSDEIFAKPLSNSRTEEILTGVHEFCRKFYELNSTALQEVDRLESELELMCETLELTVADLGMAAALIQEHRSVTSSMAALRHVDFSCGDRVLQAKALSEVAKDLLDLHSVREVEALRTALEQMRKWARNCATIERFLNGSGFVKFAKLEPIYRQCTQISSCLPPLAARPILPSWTVDIGAIRRCLDEVAATSASKSGRPRAILEKLSRWAGKLDVPSDPSSGYEKCRFDVALGIVFLSRDLAEDASERFTRTASAIESQLAEYFSSATHSAAVTLQIWVYYQLVQLESYLERRIRIMTGATNDVQGHSAEIVKRASQLIARTRGGKIRIPDLSGYVRSTLPQLPLPGTLKHNKELSEDQTLDVVSSLCAKVEEKREAVLIPIQEALSEISNRKVVPLGKFVQGLEKSGRIELNVTVNGNLSIADQIIQLEDNSVSTNEVLIGDGVVFHGDFAVGQSIRDSFNKVASSDADDRLKQQLSELSTAVASLCEKLPPAGARDAARDLDTLVEEAAKKRPRRRWFQLSADDLKQAAKALGAIGEPVIAIIDRIRKFVENAS